MIAIKRSSIRLYADPCKVLLRFLNFGTPERFKPVIDYVSRLEESAALAQLKAIQASFKDRHFELDGVFKEHFKHLEEWVQSPLSVEKKLLLGAYFTHEYSLEAAALFNPSIVPHPEQHDLPAGALRFILSMRATGEGHISSLAFLSGIIDADDTIRLEERSARLHSGIKTPVAGSALSYDLAFPDFIPLSGRVIFPASPSETNGIEDARFTLFNGGQASSYLATYTAYNGREIRPQLIETSDFRHFRIRPLLGNAVSDKGMAIFPEKINGQYAMVSRQGGRSLSIMFSEDLYDWKTFQPLQQPRRDWEMLQMGNCGSPVKTPKGWLLLTHAVGPMRKYVLSISLLDLEEPWKVLASLEQPLLEPNEEEREGYVPNVLYTCGMLEHRGRLLIPYAMSDRAISFATVETAQVLAALGQ